jgi:hypothetical protein
MYVMVFEGEVVRVVKFYSEYGGRVLQDALLSSVVKLAIHLHHERQLEFDGLFQHALQYRQSP